MNDKLPEVIRNLQTPEAIDAEEEFAQMALRSILGEDALREIPVVKTAVAAVSLVGSVRDYTLLRKLRKFLLSLSERTQWEREDMVSRLRSDPAYNRNVGQHVVELLDSSDSHRKPTMYGNAFAAFAGKEIDLVMLLRLISAIERLPSHEVQTVRKFVESENNPPARDEINPESIQALSNAGLAVIHGSGFGGQIAYRPTQTCLKFIELSLDLKSG